MATDGAPSRPLHSPFPHNHTRPPLPIEAAVMPADPSSKAAVMPADPSSKAAVMPSSERKQMKARLDAFLLHWENTAQERMTEFAEFSKKCRKNGHPPTLPPLEIVKFPELLGRAWGWDEILPYKPKRNWSLYMTYLQEYYARNAPATFSHQMEAGAADLGINGEDRNGLAALVNLCINVEGELLHRLKFHAQEFNADEISLNDKITNCAHQITNMENDGLPIVALKCIMAEADLLCELLMMSKTRMTSLLSISCQIRKFALRFMTYKGPLCFSFAASATMMATTREAKLMCELLRNKCREYDFLFTRSRLNREHTLAAMLRICQECSAAQESTGGRTAAELKCDETNCSEEIVSEEDLLERNKRNQNTKDEYYDKSGSAMGIVGENLGRMNETKHESKALNNDVSGFVEELMNRDNLKATERRMNGDNLKATERRMFKALNNDVNCSDELMNGDNLEMGERQKTKEESLKGDGLSKSENLKIENSLLTQNCDESDDKVSLKEKVAEQGHLKGMDLNKHSTKLGDLLRTSSNEGSKVRTTLMNKNNKKVRRQFLSWSAGFFSRLNPGAVSRTASMDTESTITAASL